MIKSVFIGFLLIWLGAIISVHGQQSEFAPEDLSNDCDDALENFANDSTNESPKGGVVMKHVRLAMKKGDWSCAKEIVFLAQKQDIVNIDLKNDFEFEQRAIVKEMATLRTVIESSLPMSTVSPAFQWAQSATEILLNVKFSHKIDAPATLNVEATNVTILPTQLILHASDGRKNFKLEIDLLREIVPEESRYDMASVGRMTFNLKKAEAPNKWSRLLKLRDKKIAHMHVWWEMQEKHRVELDRLEDDSDGDEKKVVKGKAKATVNDTATASSNNTAPEPQRATKSKALLARLEKIEKEVKSELKAAEDDGKKRKQSIDSRVKDEKQKLDAQAKVDKQAVDAEVLAKKEDIEKKFRLQKLQAEADAKTVEQEIDSMATQVI